VGDPELDALLAESMELAAKRSKAPKADLQSALVSGSSLIFDNKRYSMSNLATELLQREGFTSKAVRGPTHWVTEDGKTVKQLWEGSESAR